MNKTSIPSDIEELARLAREACVHRDISSDASIEASVENGQPVLRAFEFPSIDLPKQLVANFIRQVKKNN